jgi:hypothetical protein
LKDGFPVSGKIYLLGKFKRERTLSHLDELGKEMFEKKGEPVHFINEIFSVYFIRQ